MKTGVLVDTDFSGSDTPGDTIFYSFAVRNNGTVTITDLTIADPLAPVVGGPIWLAPSQEDTTTFSSSYTITQADIDAGSVDNTATASGTVPTGTVSATATYTVPLTGAADIRVSKIRTSPDATVTVGQPVSWRLSVENLGNGTSAPVTIEDSWTAGAFTFDSSDPVADSQIANTAHWNLGVLSPSATRTIDVTMTAASPLGTVYNSAYSITTTSTTGTADVYIGEVDLLTTKTRVTPSPIQSGDDVTWLISVENTGNLVAAPVTVEDTWTAGAFTWRSSSIPPNNPPVSNEASFTIASLASGETTSFTVTLRSTAVTGTHDNTAMAETPLDPTPESSTATVTVIFG